MNDAGLPLVGGTRGLRIPRERGETICGVPVGVIDDAEQHVAAWSGCHRPLRELQAHSDLGRSQPAIRARVEAVAEAIADDGDLQRRHLDNQRPLR